MAETAPVHRRAIDRAADSVLKYEWIVLGLLAVPLLFPRPSWTPFLLFLPLLWGVRWRRTGSFLPATSLNLGLLILAVMLLVSLWATFSIAFSLDKISGLVFSLAVFFLVARSSGQHFQRALVAFLLGGLAIAGLGLVSTDWPSKIPYVDRLAGQLPGWVKSLPSAPNGIHPNELGGVLVLFVPLAAVLAIRGAEVWRGRRWTNRLWLGLATAFMVAVTLLTQSRSALLGLFLGLAVLLALSGRRGQIILAVLALVSVAAVAWIGPARIVGSDQLQTTSPVGEITLVSRVEIWSRAVYGLEDFSFTGMGMGTFRRVVPVLYPLFTISPNKDIAHAHNIFLQTGLDLGIPGLIAYVSLWLGAFAMLASLLRHREAGPVAFGLSTRRLALGLCGGLVAHLVFSMTDAVALGARPGFLWWYLLGLVVGLYKLQGAGKREKVTGDRKSSLQLTADS